jgi:hypothetical protein
LSLPEAWLTLGPAGYGRIVISSGVRLGEDEARARTATAPVAWLGTAKGPGWSQVLVVT